MCSPVPLSPKRGLPVAGSIYSTAFALTRWIVGKNKDAAAGQGDPLRLVVIVRFAVAAMARDA